MSTIFYILLIFSFKIYIILIYNVDEYLDIFMKNKLLKVLNELGLSEKEAKVYLALLSLGEVTVLSISKEAGIKRTTVYSVLDSLKQKGLVEVVVRGFKTFYRAVSPENLVAVIEERQQKLNKYLPDFLSLYNASVKESYLRYYEGLPAIKSIYEDLLKSVKIGDDYLVISDQEKWYSLDPEYFEDFLRRRSKLNIKIRLLLQDSPIARQHQKIQKFYNETIKFLPAGTKLDTNLVIIPQRVVIHQTVPPIKAIVIDSPIVAKMHKEFFEIMWRFLPD